MQGLTTTPLSKLSFIVASGVLLLGMLAGIAHGNRWGNVVDYDVRQGAPVLTDSDRFGGITSYAKEPCKRMTVYHHDILYNGENTANATSEAASQPTVVSQSVSTNDTYFGQLVVFDDVVTAEQALSSDPVARAQGFYFYNKKEGINAWFAFSLVFDSPAYRGTLNLMGANLVADKKRDLSVVGGTGDFLMARGIATVSTDSLEGLYYFGLKMDIKLHECYVVERPHCFSFLVDNNKAS